jgi:hypothetical protein
MSFETTAPELSIEANAILAYARKWGTPFTRAEIVDIAPGAAWDTSAPYPSTMAKRDPIAELVKTKMIEHCGTRATVSQVRNRRPGTYKVYRLTGRLTVPSLAELLDDYASLRIEAADEAAEAVRTEILDRFGGPR